MQLAISNPAMYLALAVRGTGPFSSPIPLRAITIIPSPDQLAFAVTEKTGLRSLRDIRGRRYPLRVSMRGQKDHALHPIVDLVFTAAGFSLADIISWGGLVRYDDGLPLKSNRFGAMQRGEVDMIVDEAVRGWIDTAAEAGMRALPLDEAMLTKLEKHWTAPRGNSQSALSKDASGRADPRFQRIRGLHPCRGARRHHNSHLRRARGAQRPHRLARARPAAARTHVP